MNGVAFDRLTFPPKPWLMKTYFQGTRMHEHYILEYSDTFNENFQFFQIYFLKFIGHIILLLGIYMNIENIEVN
jgi:hypothetical protein